MKYAQFIVDCYAMIDSKTVEFIDEQFSGERVSWKSVSEYMFGFSTKQAVVQSKKIFAEDEFDFSMVKAIRVLSNKLKLNREWVIEALAKYDGSAGAYINDRKITQKFVNQLLGCYPEKRVIGLMLDKRQHFIIDDTADMFDEVTNLGGNLQKIVPRRPKTLREIHDKVARVIPRLNMGNFPLNQREDIAVLDGKNMVSGLTIRVPETHHDLVDLGEDLSFCIGNGVYSRGVRDGLYSIVAVFNKNKPLYAIQFTRYKIQQAKGFDNSDLPIEIINDLRELLTSQPKIPTDFIKIKDSAWIYGYKYDNKDLYIMMNERIYVYYDVPQDVYDGLVSTNKKGRYVNSVIKRGYQYDQVM